MAHVMPVLIGCSYQCRDIRQPCLVWRVCANMPMVAPCVLAKTAVMTTFCGQMGVEQQYQRHAVLFKCYQALRVICRKWDDSNKHCSNCLPCSLTCHPLQFSTQAARVVVTPFLLRVPKPQSGKHLLLYRQQPASCGFATLMLPYGL